MVNIDRVRVALTGFPGGPGVATFYGSVGPDLATFLHAFWSQAVVSMPSTVNMTVEPAGDTINDATGAIVGAWSHAATASVTGTSGVPYAAPVGLQVTWLTQTIVDGKRLKGRTFFVPMGGGQYQADGTLSPTIITAYQGIAATMVVDGTNNFRIWHRPRVARAATPTSPAVTARAGSSGLVTGSRIADKVVVLRSRRD